MDTSKYQQYPNTNTTYCTSENIHKTQTETIKSNVKENMNFEKLHELDHHS